MILPTLIAIDDPSRVAQCRRRSKALARSLGFSEVDRERVGIAVTEAVTNVLRHATSGYYLAQPCPHLPDRCLSVLIWDDGPGISNLQRCLQDGFSSAQGQGIGLGAMQRQANAFEVYSKPKGGLVVNMTFQPSTLGNDAKPNKKGAFCDLFATAIPMPGQEKCGDAWAVEQCSGVTKILLVDGLGHGPKAAKAAQLAIKSFPGLADLPGESIIHSLNDKLRGSRGAVAAVAELDPVAERLRYTGIGNISGRLIVEGTCNQLTSRSGIVGYQMSRVSSFEYDWKPNSMIVLHSDGIGSKWSLDRFPGLSFSSSSTVAGVLLSEMRKWTDDSSVVVAGFHGNTNTEAEA